MKINFSMFWKKPLLLYCLIIIGNDSSQPADQGAITGLSTSIPCELGRQVPAPFWFINNTVYELFSIPQYFPLIPEVNSYTSLSIPFVTFMVDNVVFRCATFERNGNLSPNSNAFRLVVQGENLEIPEHSVTALLLDYQRLFIQMDSISVAWSFRNICNEEFELQGFVISNGQAVRFPAHDIQNVSSSTVKIPTTQLYDNSSDIVYRLVAVWQNGTVCSDRTSQDTYYRFEGAEFLQTMVSTPRSRNICFDIPSTDACGASLYFIWPRQEEGLSCLCPVYDSDDGRSVFAACIRGCTNIDIIPRLGEGKVCIPNLNASMSEALTHFMCSTDPCTGNCFIKTILSSYRLSYAEEELPLVGLYSQTSVLCDVETGLGFPDWFLNDTLYTLTSLLQLYPLFSVGGNNSLMIVVIPEVDNTVFQCAALDGNAVVFGIPTRIIINPNLEGNDLVESEDITICFNYQDLEISNSSVRIGWKADTQDDCDFFQVQRISSHSLTSPDVVIADVVVETNSISADIGLNNFLNASYFRIVAVSDNGSICSDVTSENSLYSFIDSQVLNTTYGTPNSPEVCIDIPIKLEECGSTVVVWDKKSMCNLRYNVSDCPCESSIGCPTFSNSTHLCFTDRNYSLNGTLYHFLYTCRPLNCNGCSNIMLTTILSSHKIVISEPPTEPYINYTSSLCFSTTSLIEVEIEYTIPAIGLSSNIDNYHDCIDDPFREECRNFSVTALATNAVGSSSENVMNFTSNACKVLPSKLHISYNNGSLCFEVNSLANFTLNYTISTTEEPNFATKTLLRPRCVVDPFPDDCRDFSVSACAINSAGSIQEVMNFTSAACQGQNEDFTVVIVAVVITIVAVVVALVVLILILVCCIVKNCKNYHSSNGEVRHQKGNSEYLQNAPL